MATSQARQYLIDFEIATGSIENGYDPNWHHEIIARELEHIETFGDRDYKILIVTVPPRHGKSQQCSIDFPAWYLGRNPEKEIITSSYSADLAQTFGGKTREKVASEEYQAIFPRVRLREDEKSRGHWRTNKGGGYLSVGVGGSITGHGADVAIVDDPVKNREEAESQVYRDKTWDWFTSTLFTRLHPRAVVVLVMTRWHMDDIAGRILENSDLALRTKVIHFRAISEFDEPQRKANHSLWRVKYPLRALKEIKATVGPYDFAALYQGSPILTEHQEFKPTWRRSITEKEVSMMSTRRILTVDTAISKRSQADYTGFCDNRINRENFWHLRAWRARLGPEELVEAIFNLHTTNHYEKIGVEKTTYLDGLKPYLDAEQRKRGVFLPIVPLEHKQTAKEIRIRGLIPRYSSGSVFHLEGECSALEEEQTNFPFGIHDDVLDATAYQLQVAENSGSGRTVVTKPNWAGYNRRS